MKQEHFHIVSLNHRNTTIDQVGGLHVPEDRQQAFLTGLKEQLGVQGITYLDLQPGGFMLVDEAYFCMGRLQQLFQFFQPDEETCAPSCPVPRCSTAKRPSVTVPGQRGPGIHGPRANPHSGPVGHGAFA